MNRKNKLSVILLLTIVWGGKSFLYAQPDQKKSPGADKVPVEVIVAGRSDISSSLKATGTVEAYLKAAVSAQVGGEVTRVYTKEGEMIAKDAPLIQIDDYTLKLQLGRAEANFIGMKSGYEYIKQIAVLQVETRLKQARAGAAAALAQYEYAKNIAETALNTKLKQAKANRDIAAARLKQLKSGARPEEREQVLAARNSAQANYDNALNNFKRIKKLFAQGAVSNQRYDDAKTREEAAEAQLTTAIEAWNLVEKGARDEDVDSAEANLRQAQAAYELVKKEVDSQSWEKDIALARSAWEKAEANRILAEKQLDSRAYEADIRQAEARYKDARANLKILQRQVERALLRAPFAGIVHDRQVEVGETVSPGRPLINVIQLSKVKVASAIGEISASRLSLGQSVRVTIDAYNGREFTGRITEISPAVDSNSRTVALKVELDNPDNLLKPGMFARLSVELARHEKVIVVPKDVLVAKDGRQYVYLVRNGKAVAREVEVGLESGDSWEITSGLEEGDTVVYIGQSGLSDGKDVVIVNK